MSYAQADIHSQPSKIQADPALWINYAHIRDDRKVALLQAVF